MSKGLQQIRNSIRRIAVVAIEGDDDVAGGGGKATLVGATVAANVFADHHGPVALGDDRRAIRGAVIDDDDLIDEFRHALKHLLHAFLFVQAGNDDGNRLVVVQGRKE